MKQWYFPMVESFKPEVGFEIQFEVHYKDKIYHKLWKATDAIPGRKIAYSWKYGGHSGDSVLSFELFNKRGKTRLRLTHVGLVTFASETNPDYAPGNFLAVDGLDRLAKGFFWHPPNLELSRKL